MALRRGFSLERFPGCGGEKQRPTVAVAGDQAPSQSMGQRCPPTAEAREHHDRLRAEMRDVLTALGRDSAIYGAANAGTAVLALVLVPIYTHRLTTSEFGAYS